jgi:hypothetical protein
MRRLIIAVLMVLALVAFASSAFANPNGTINPLGTAVSAPYADIKPW